MKTIDTKEGSNSDNNEDGVDTTDVNYTVQQTMASTALTLETTSNAQALLTNRTDDDTQSAPSNQPKESTFVRNTKRGIVFILMGCLWGQASNTTTRLTVNEYYVHPVDLLAVRAIFGVILYNLLLKATKQERFDMNGEDRYWLNMRVMVTGAWTLLLTFGSVMIPLTIASTLQTINPLFVALISFLWLGEEVTIFQVFAIIVCAMAVVAMIFSGTDEGWDEAKATPIYGSFAIGCSLYLISVILGAFNMVMLRKLQRVNPLVIQEYVTRVMCLLYLVFALIVASVDGDPFRIFKYDFQQYGYIILTTILGMLTLICIIVAVKNERPAFISIFSYSNIALAVIMDFLFFGYPITGIQILCICIVFILGITNALFQLKSSNQNNQDNVGGGAF